MNNCMDQLNKISLALLASMLLIFLFSVSCSVTKEDKTIPFEEALADASIKVRSLNSSIDDALIIGNGDINALVYSDSSSIIMNLTKNDIWDARLITANDPPLPTLDLIKQLGASETDFPLKNNNRSYVLPPGMTWEAEDSYHSTAYPCPRQAAKIVITSQKHGADFSGELNLCRAVAAIKQNNAAIVKVRALACSNVFLIETAAPVVLEPIVSTDLPAASCGEMEDVKWLKQEIPGDLDWPGMAFAVAVSSAGNSRAVAIVTSIESNDVVGEAVKLAQKTASAELSSLIKKHEVEWKNYWSQSGVKMSDRFLQATWYHSLYFLRCFSKPGVQSVGLFGGLINDTPAWHGDYHTNYNLQQTYWTAYPTNHPDIAEPYDRLMFEYLTRAKWLSRKVFSMQGAYYPHVLFAYEHLNPATSKSRIGRQYFHHVWAMTIGVSGFTVQPLWWRYKYDPDLKRLENIIYPAVKEVAAFYADFIEQCDGDKTVHLGPSVSPEHWGWTKHLERNYNSTFDIAMIHCTLNAAIEAARTLKQDEVLALRFEKALQRLPDYPLYGEEQPFVVDVEGAPPIVYNIPVPATPVFPGDVVTWWSPEEEKEFFRRTIDGLQWNGNNATIMLAIARARLSMPKSQEWLATELKARTRPNGTFSLNRLIPHHRFNDFGHYTEQFGAGMAISELLLQSVGDIIRVFPALSHGIRAYFKDLRTQGGFLVTAEGTAENVEKLQIKSLYGGELRLSSPWQKIEASTAENQKYSPLKTDQRGVVTIQTKAGDTLVFRSF